MNAGESSDPTVRPCVLPECPLCNPHAASSAACSEPCGGLTSKGSMGVYAAMVFRCGRTKSSAFTCAPAVDSAAAARTPDTPTARRGAAVRARGLTATEPPIQARACSIVPLIGAAPFPSRVWETGRGVRGGRALQLWTACAVGGSSPCTASCSTRLARFANPPPHPAQPSSFTLSPQGHWRAAHGPPVRVGGFACT